MWNTALAVNSFIIWPATIIFFLYSLGRGVFVLDWKVTVIGLVLFLVSSAAGLALGILAE